MNGEWRVIGRGVAWPLVVGALAGALVAGCADLTNGGGPSATYPGTPNAQNGIAVTGPAAPKTVSYNLYTHCGIYEAKVAGHWYLATPPLSDGNGNPPAGWGNPQQHGTMTLVSAAEVVFTDQAGHRVVFRAAPAAGKYPSQICS